ncbi:ABC transporter permease [Pseudoneobacillus sp. C159]
MKIWSIAYYTFLRHIRDYKSVLAFIGLPIVLIIILGTALNSEFTPKRVDSMNVGLLSLDDEEVVENALLQLFEANEIKELVTIKKVENIESGKDLVKSGELKAFIYLNQYLTKDLTSGNKATIELYTKDERTFIQPVLEGFVRTFNVNQIMMNLSDTPVAQQVATSSVEELKIVTEGKTPRGIDYYSIASLFQALLFGSLFGVFAITKDLGNHTSSRLLAAPIPAWQVRMGKLIGSTLTLYLISLVIFSISKFVFKANWNASMWLILLVLFLFCLTSIGMGMILGYVTRNTMISALTIFVGTTVLTLVAGGFSPMEGKLIDILSKFSPNAYSQKLLFTNIYEGTIATSILLQFMLYACLIVVGTFQFGRRKVA